MTSELKPSNLDYGVVLAFVAPGFVAFLGASYHLPTAQTWMTAAAEKDQSVGVFLFVFLASLSAGLMVSGVRAVNIDKVLGWKFMFRRFAVPPYKVEWKGIDDKNLPVIVTIRDAYYRYYQFYSNTFVAMLFWTVSLCAASGSNLKWMHWTVIAAILATLLLSARIALNNYANALRNLFEQH